MSTLKILITENLEKFRNRISQNEFSDANIILDDFLSEILRVSALKVEDGSPQWAKWIDGIDPSKKNGWCFIGDFINEGTVEFEIGRPRLILAQSSLKNEALRSGYLRQFRVIKLDVKGNLIPTHIATDDSRGGWALRIRDLTANMLKDLEYQKPEQDDRNRFSNVELP